MSAIAKSSLVALALLLFWAILTIWVPEHWSFGIVEAGVFGLAATWAILFTLRPYTVRGTLVLIPLAGAVIIGLVQLMTGTTVNRWETWNAVLRWAAYLTVFLLASQICSEAAVSRAFRLMLLYFGFAVSVLAVLQFFTSAGKIFWVFPSEFPDGTLGPFLNRDHYAAFVELVLPIVLFEAITDRRKMFFGAGMAGAMLASVIAGGSRAGSVLVILESATVILLMSRRDVRLTRKTIGVCAALLVLCSLVFTAVVGWSRLLKGLQEPNPFRGRREMLIATVAMARARPWSGFGLGNFENAYPGYAIFDAGEVVDHAHNDWAEWTAEGGVPFLGCLLAVAIWSVLQVQRHPWGLGAVFVLLHSLVDFPMQRPALALWFFVLLGAMSVRAASGSDGSAYKHR